MPDPEQRSMKFSIDDALRRFTDLLAAVLTLDHLQQLVLRQTLEITFWMGQQAGREMSPEGIQPAMQQLCEMAQHALKNDKIQVIKSIRQMTGATLKDAKEAIDRVMPMNHR